MQATTTQTLFAQVYLITGVPKPLTYGVPADLIDSICPGSLVQVPLQNRSTLAVVADTSTQAPEFKTKPIKSLLYNTPILPPHLLKLALWMSSYYAASVDSIFETMIPGPIRNPVQEKTIPHIQPATFTQEDIQAQRSPKQTTILEFFQNNPDPIPKAQLLDKLSLTAAPLNALIKKGLLTQINQVQQRIAYQDPLAQAETINTEPPQLNAQQQTAVDSLSQSLDENSFKVHLLQGVTGSGKTEVYLKLIEQALQKGGTALFLVPEVALTPQTLGRVQSRLTQHGHKVLVWHSMLSAGERHDAWTAIARGEVQVVIGARSATFAPLPNLKLIIVDEEHEPAYKQNESPRYHGRDVAVYRAKLENALCILGSATPSLESLHNAQSGKYHLNTMTQRIDGCQLPLVHVVDMRPELIKAKGSPLTLSQTLKEKLLIRYENNEQSILFINRRGFSPRILCTDCDYVAECEHCSLSLTYHRLEHKLRCHMCGFQTAPPSACPKCSSDKLRQSGSGTQRIEEAVSKFLPKATIYRIDADTMSKKNRFREILSDFRKGKIDILVGTQMIAKGLDFPNVTLVGLIDADISLHIPDFRAHERTFQLVTQVSGRAGRGDRAGEVVLQTFLPHSPPIQFSRRNEFEGFFTEELANRKQFHYPPYRNLIRHLMRSKDLPKLEQFAQGWFDYLKKHCPDDFELRGPMPAPIEKVKDYYRYQLWIFSPNNAKTIHHLQHLRNHFPKDKDVIDLFDVDPTDLS